MKVAIVVVLTTMVVVKVVPVVVLVAAVAVVMVPVTTLISNVRCVISMGTLRSFAIFTLMGIINQIPL